MHFYIKLWTCVFQKHYRGCKVLKLGLKSWGALSTGHQNFIVHKSYKSRLWNYFCIAQNSILHLAWDSLSRMNTPSINPVTNTVSVSAQLYNVFKKFLLQTMSPEQFNNLMLVTVYLEWLNALNLISIASKFSDCKHKENQFC